LETALAGGYRAARVDLGMLLARPSAALLDVPRAISLYERAWTDGVTIAAFELGSLYEHGVSRGGDTGDLLLAPDSARAWFWYRKAAAAGEPNALAHLAEREEGAALTAESAAQKSSLLIDAFKHYAAATERARREAWPEDVWRNWRYRRASLARLLAREGRMQEVAEAHDTVIEQYADASPSIWKRLAAFVGHSGSDQFRGGRG
jgi:hypothetical protein